MPDSGVHRKEEKGVNGWTATRSTPGQIPEPSVRTEDNGFIEADDNTLD